MKLKILLIELIFQTLLSVGSILYITYDYLQTDQLTELFIALFFVGVANLLGFIIRISLIASKFHRYYFFGVISFFVILYALSKFDSEMNFILCYLGIGGVLFNIYYLSYGFYLIKNYPADKVDH